MRTQPANRTEKSYSSNAAILVCLIILLAACDKPKDDAKDNSYQHSIAMLEEIRTSLQACDADPVCHEHLEAVRNFGGTPAP